MSGSRTVTAPPSQAVVTYLVETFNARDIDGMLACLHPEVELHPLKLGWRSGVYHGHDAVRRWFAEFTRLGLDYLIELEDVRVQGEGEVIALGSVGVGHGAIAPFGAVHRLAGGLIVAARQYLSDAELLRIRGVIT